MFTGKSQYFYCWYFYTMSVWVVWLGKLTGLMVGIIRKAMFCSNKHSAKAAEREGKTQFPPCVYMPTHESHLAALNCRKTIRAKHSNICMHDSCNMFSASSSFADRTSIGNPQMLGTLHEFYITPDHYHNDAIKDIRSLQRCFLLHRDLS